MYLIMFNKSLLYVLVFLFVLLYYVYIRMGLTVKIEILKYTIDNGKRQTAAEVLHATDLMEKFELEVPEECKKTNFCENIPNYPEELMKKLIKRLQDSGKFYSNASVSRTSYKSYRGLPLCDMDERVFIPKAVVNENGYWILVLNSNDNPVQTFKGAYCKVQGSKCLNNSFKFQPTHCGNCFTSYIKTEVIALNEDMNKVIRQSVRLPRCCNCRAKNTCR